MHVKFGSEMLSPTASRDCAPPRVKPITNFKRNQAPNTPNPLNPKLASAALKPKLSTRGLGAFKYTVESMRCSVSLRLRILRLGH